MLDNIFPIEEVRTLARARGKQYSTKSIHPKLVEDEIGKGWKIFKSAKNSVRLKREKPHGQALEDRVWTLLYKMKFEFLSGEGGAKIRLDARDSGAPVNQLDVVGIDSELALVIECKSSERFARRPQFQEELAKFSQFRDRFSKSANAQWPSGSRRQTALLFFLQNVNLSDNDRERAKTANVILFDEKDLDYYEKLTGHLGPAAKYQFFADMLPGKTIPGLAIKVPAVKTKMGPYTCYTFPVSPEYLLKISYVSHRSKGKASDVHTYQRMLVKSRLNTIRQYITDHGIFPTNIVVNIDKRCLDFQKIKQENTAEDKDASGTLGWLDIRPAFKAAWIIDGQHRLFAYSGHPAARTGHLSVLAFEGIKPSTQAKLFIDINAKQKSVKPSLLQELFAELHWDAETPNIRIQAIVSKAVQILGADKASPFFGRIQLADSGKDFTRCVSLTSLYKAIEKQGFYVVREARGTVLEWGPLWASTNEATLDRTVAVLKAWFNGIRQGAPDWWDLGSAEGGGLAMNDSIVAFVNVLKSVFAHLEGTKSSKKLGDLDNEDLSQIILPYARALAAYLGGLSNDDRHRYRDLRGTQGQTSRTRRFQQAIKAVVAQFEPPGLEEFMRREKEQTNLKGKEIIDRLEVRLKEIVVQELKQEFSADSESWWQLGVPKAVRLDVGSRKENDDNRRGGRESYFDLIDYRKIALAHWPLFQTVLGYGKKTDSKDKQTRWIVEVNEMRNLVSHASSGLSLSVEKVAELELYATWLDQKVMGDSDVDIVAEIESEETADDT